jgi:hypothetical protein
LWPSSATSAEEDSVKGILLLFDKSSKIMTEISPKDLADCTAEVSARNSLGVWPQASLAAICYKAGADLDSVALS